MIKKLTGQERFIIICAIAALLFMYASIIVPSSSEVVESDIEQINQEQEEDQELVVLGKDR
ncbi:hypothetical protein [Bacillus suaedae]|uniref:Uncharacterized protein n=1 Tax=Halalkalibacter suaedae TaxID=2822140 RepID=A0A940WY52_9BACI|nr:hypothetical protein [Bacillus suaedae]MBP3952818.1 hypothetical protein [Bacillus suaedae]